MGEIGTAIILAPGTGGWTWTPPVCVPTWVVLDAFSRTSAESGDWGPADEDTRLTGDPEWVNTIIEG